MSFKYKDQSIADSNTDIYSTDEVRIGTWIDGKPLYRIVVKTKMPTTKNTWISIVPRLENATVVRYELYWDTGNSYLSFPSGGSAGISGFESYTYNSSPSGLRVYLISDGATGKDALAILEYTKDDEVGD